MNAERLHAIALVIQSEMNSLGTVEKMQQLQGTLQDVINQPQQPQHQARLGTTLKSIYESLSKSPSDNFSPAWRQILKELGGELLLGKALMQHIQSIFERNQITFAIALDEIRKSFTALQAFKNAIDQVISGFKQLRIGSEKLNPGECEIGFLVPRAAIEDNMREFGKELGELNFILDTFMEVATGKRDQAKLKNISSSDYMVYLNTCILVGGLVTFAVKEILTAYRQLLEIRKLQGELLEQGIPKENTEGIKQHVNLIMENRIEKITIEVIKTYYKGKDPDRKNELENAVRISLKKIANRIDKGYNIDVRVEPPKGLKEAKESVEQQETERLVNLIQESSQALQYLKLQGEPLLHLSEKPVEKREKEGVRHVKVRRRMQLPIDTGKDGEKNK